MTALFFYFILVCIFFSGLGVIFSKNPVHSIFFLVCVFLNIAVLFLFLDVEFIAIIFLIIYVGAIAILFLFVVMMLNIKAVEYQQTALRYAPISSFLCFTFFFQILHLLYIVFNPSDLTTMTFIDSKNESYSVFLSWVDLYNFVDHTKLLGTVLYTYFIIPFLICGLILLIAMIASIVLTLTKEVDTKRQQLFKQLLRNNKNTIELKKKK